MSKVYATKKNIAIKHTIVNIKPKIITIFSQTVYILYSLFKKN